MDDKKMTGKEARYVLRQRRVSLVDLASRLGISPQALSSRLNAETFSHSRQVEINKVMGEDIFDVSAPLTDRQPILDIRQILDNVRPPQPSQAEEVEKTYT